MIPSYIYFAILSMLLVGVADFVYGKAARKGIPYATLTCSQAIFVTLTNGVWAYTAGVYAWSLPFLISVAAAVLFFIAFWAFMRSVTLGEASISTPIYRINFVATSLMAILFLNEAMTPRKGVGFLLAGIAIFLLSDFRIYHRSSRRIRWNSIFWAIVAMFSMGSMNFLWKIAAIWGLPLPMLFHTQAVFFTVITFTFSYVTQGGPRFSRDGWIYGISVGGLLIVGMSFFYLALGRAEVTVVTPISQLSFVVSVIMATVWMRERLTARKTIGLLMAAGTIASFSL
ncbi:MAG: DMT family transporter [Deltaproteobacteria bacterium]|nr:DMT family transporter [Deltaproteobacteria bacterium]